MYRGGVGGRWLVRGQYGASYLISLHPDEVALFINGVTLPNMPTIALQRQRLIKDLKQIKDAKG